MVTYTDVNTFRISFTGPSGSVMCRASGGGTAFRGGTDGEVLVVARGVFRGVFGGAFGWAFGFRLSAELKEGPAAVSFYFEGPCFLMEHGAEGGTMVGCCLWWGRVLRPIVRGSVDASK